MIHRCLGWIGAGALLTVLALATVPVAGQAPAPAKVNGTAAKGTRRPRRRMVSRICRATDELHAIFRSSVLRA
jgi:hypothetical protein